MQKVIFIALVLSFLLISCQKELSNSNLRRVAGDSTGRLERVVSYSGAFSQDSTVGEYIYDANGRLIEERAHLVLHDSLLTVNKEFYTKYYRDEWGRITKFTTRGPVSDSGNETDTLIETVTYRAPGSTQVAYLNDSSRVYEYDAQGRVAKTLDYRHDVSPPDRRKLAVYHVYSYDTKGNLASREEYTDRNGDGNFELNISYYFEYDEESNPLHFTDDAMLEFKWYLFASTNNLIKLRYDIADPNGLDDQASASYEYRMDGQPASSTYLGNGQTIFSIYYYQ